MSNDAQPRGSVNVTPIAVGTVSAAVVITAGVWLLDGYPSVLVRLGAVDREELAELLADAWRTRAPKRLADSLDA